MKAMNLKIMGDDTQMTPAEVMQDVRMRRAA